MPGKDGSHFSVSLPTQYRAYLETLVELKVPGFADRSLAEIVEAWVEAGIELATRDLTAEEQHAIWSKGVPKIATLHAFDGEPKG